MSRLVFALPLAGCMVCLTALAGVEPGSQEKKTTEDPPAKADKKEDQSKSTKDKAPAPSEKKAVEAKVGVKVMAVPLQPARAVKQAVKAVPRRVFAIPPPPGVDADIFEQQFWPQFKSMHKGELHFMRMVCQPTREQFERIAADSEPPLREVLKKFAGQNQNGMVIVNAGRVGQVDDEQQDVPRQTALTISKSVRKVLPAEQADRYDKEIAERMDASNRVVVRGFVIKMDKLLHLSSDQREALLKLLNGKWKYSATRARILTVGDQYFPIMPDTEINQILSEPQRRIWSTVQKGNINFGMQLEVPAQADFEEVWEEPATKPESPSSKTNRKQSGPEKKESQ